MTDVRLIERADAEPAWNMAVDAALLEAADDSRQASLRFYGWRPAALSIGYFQSAAARQNHPASQNLDLVRRHTGGGAIVHDRELTYCVVTPERNRLGPASALVDAFHTALTEALTEWGIASRQFGQAKPENREKDPFLCFQRRTQHDLIIDDRKVTGSAQRRLRNSVLTHGSVLLAKSVHAPELPGIVDLTGKEVLPDQLAEVWIGRLAHRLNWRCVSSEMTSAEQARCRHWLTTRYSCRSWNHRR